MTNIRPSHKVLLTRLPGILLIGMCWLLVTVAAFVLGMFWLLVTVAAFPESAGAQERVPGGEGFKLYGVEDVGPKPSWRVGGSAFYTTGKYGTNSTTDTLYVPLSLRRIFDDGYLNLVIPYVTVTSNCNVTFLSGVPQRTTGLCANSPTTTPPGGTGTRTGKVTASGLGDVLLIGRYFLYTEREGGVMPSILVSGRVKAPTADRNQGLGTGEWDGGGGLGLMKLLSNQLVLLADGGYSYIGKPPGVSLRNQWSYDAGLGYYFVPSLFGTVYYEEARALISGLQNPRDIFAGLTWKLTEDFRLTAGVEKGLTSGAPDLGGSVGASLQF